MTPELLAMLTPEEVKAWALCEGATPGPWVDMTSAGPDVGGFDGEIRAALSFDHVCSDPEGDDRPNDRAFIAGSRDALPNALTTIATLRASLVDRDELSATVARLSDSMVVIDARARACSADVAAEVERLRAENATLRKAADDAAKGAT